jgi:hypothetical protein
MAETKNGYIILARKALENLGNEIVLRVSDASYY